MASDPDSSPLPKRCLDCGYILDGLPENRCPECGRPFDPANSRTYGPGRLPGAPYRSAAVWGLILIVFPPVGAALLAKYAADAPTSLHTLSGIVAFLAVLSGLAMELVVLPVSAIRLWTGPPVRQDRAEFRRALVISLCALLLVIAGFALLPMIASCGSH